MFGVWFCWKMLGVGRSGRFDERAGVVRDCCARSDAPQLLGMKMTPDDPLGRRVRAWRCGDSNCPGFRFSRGARSGRGAEACIGCWGASACWFGTGGRSPCLALRMANDSDENCRTSRETVGSCGPRRMSAPRFCPGWSFLWRGPTLFCRSPPRLRVDGSARPAGVVFLGFR